MHSLFHCFSKKLPVPSTELPLTLISLEQWIVIRITGKDNIKFLHNQLTCDVKKLNKNQYSFCTHCNSIGKTISNIYIFYTKNQEIAFIEHISVYKKQISEMKKYSIFSNVTIIPDNKTILIGITGKNSKKYLKNIFTILPNKKTSVIYNNDIIILYFFLPIERFLLIIPDTNLKILKYFLSKCLISHMEFNDSYQWMALDIEAGYPCVTLETSELFIPQAINMHTLHGISFNKGCYLGQETIARMQYRRCNQKKLCRLMSSVHTKKNSSLPKPGDHVELKINKDSYTHIGIVLQCCQIKNNDIWVQAVLNKSPEKNSEFQIRNQIQKNFFHYFFLMD